MGLYLQPLEFTSDQQVDFNRYKGCIAYTVVNKGTADCTLFDTYPLNPSDAPLVITGELGLQRVDLMSVKFGSSGTKSVFILFTHDSNIKI